MLKKLFALSLAPALVLFCRQSCQAASDMDVTACTQLRLLELKYFEHTFDNEGSAERVERIERLVRGDTGQGSPQERIKEIAEDLKADGQSLSPDPAGVVSGSRSRASRPSGAASQTTDNAGSGEIGDYPKITNLEKEILKQTYAGEPLISRIARLETRAFGSPANGDDLGTRADRLESYAEQTLHARPFAVNAEMDKPYVLAAAPAAASGAKPGEAVEHFFNLTRRLSDEFSERSSQSGGLTQRSRGLEPEEASLVNQPDDDPQVYNSNPPAAGSKMITRVGWCEVQTFGHTFPEMHLTRRLRQLGNELIPRLASQTDMQLMDDLDQIESAVKTRKSSHTANPPRP
jgi:hypothetical protein